MIDVRAGLHSRSIMMLLLLLILGTFILAMAGGRRGRSPVRPVLTLAVCTVVATAYLSLRFI